MDNNQQPQMPDQQPPSYEPPAQQQQPYQAPMPPAKPKKPFYKKWWFIVICVIVVLGVLGNALSDKSPKTTETPNDKTSQLEPKDVEAKTPEVAPAVEEKKTTFGLNDPATLKNFTITALEIKTSSGSDYIKPEEGNVFVGVKIEINNTSAEEINMSSLMLFEAYADDVKAAYSFSANVDFGEGTLDGSLSAGKKMIGWYAIEAPLGTKVVELEVLSSWLGSEKAIFVLDVPA